jgi:SAM-dependent methyltransferase
MSSRAPTPQDYDQIYRQRTRFTILDKIAARVLRNSRISRLDCTGFLAPGDPENYREAIRHWIPPYRPATLLDLGCGSGRLGVWLAQQLGLNLIGIDFSPIAISQARRLKIASLKNKETFLVAPFDSIGIQNSSIAGAFSLDALYMATDPLAALREVRRVLLPRAPLIFTYYINSDSQHDWPRLARTTGFDVVSVAECTESWRRHMREKHKRRWRRRRALEKELGQRAVSELSVTASMLGLGGRPSYISTTCRYELRAIRG